MGEGEGHPLAEADAAVPKAVEQTKLMTATGGPISRRQSLADGVVAGEDD